MRFLFALILAVGCSAQSIPFPGPGMPAAIAGGSLTWDSADNIAYMATGGNSVSHTGVGSNLIALLSVWTDSTAPTAVTYGGVTMTVAISKAVTQGAFSGTLYLYYAIGVSSGAQTVTYTAAGQSTGTVATYSNAKQSGQPDATAFVLAGTCGAMPPFDCDLPITTVADNSAVFAVYYRAGTDIFASPSDNGTFVSEQDFQSAYVWRSTANVTPAGAFTLHADTVFGFTYDVIGISIAPL